MATTKQVTKADIKAAEELEAMADAIDCKFAEDEIAQLVDLEFGQAIRSQRDARMLRKRAAELRQDPEARYM